MNRVLYVELSMEVMAATRFHGQFKQELTGALRHGPRQTGCGSNRGESVNE